MIKFYKIRAYIFLRILRVLSKLLFVKIPPIVSVTAMIKKDEKLLFLELSYLKGLGLPGGLIEHNEDAETALKREVSEETSLQITELKYLYSVNSFFQGIPTISMVYEALTKGEPTSSTEGKLVWLKPEEAKSRLAYSVTEKALERYKDLKI